MDLPGLRAEAWYIPGTEAQESRAVWELVATCLVLLEEMCVVGKGRGNSQVLGAWHAPTKGRSPMWVGERRKDITGSSGD